MADDISVTISEEENISVVVAEEQSVNVVLENGVGQDTKSVKVSSNDTTDNYLQSKLVAGTDISITVNDEGGNETLTITSTSQGVTDHSDLNELDYASSGHTGFQPSGDYFEKTTDTTDDISEGSTNKFDVPVVLNEGTNVTITGTYPEFTISSDGNASDEKVKYDANDPTAGYVADKVIAGTGISVSEGTGADENKLVITNDDKGSDVDLSGYFKLDQTTPQTVSGGFYIIDALSNATADFSQRLLSSNGTASLDWFNRTLLSSDSYTSIDYENRHLVNSAGNTIFDYDNFKFPQQTTNGILTVTDDDGTITVDTTTYEESLGNPDTDDYVLSSKTDGTRSWVEMSGSNPFDQDLNTTDDVEFNSITTPSVYDTNDVLFIDVDNNSFNDHNGNTALDLNNKYFYRDNEIVIDYGSGFLNKQDGTTSFDWQSLKFSTLTTNGVLTVTNDDGTIASVPLILGDDSGSIIFDINDEGNTFIKLNATGDGTGSVLIGGGHNFEVTENIIFNQTLTGIKDLNGVMFIEVHGRHAYCEDGTENLNFNDRHLLNSSDEIVFDWENLKLSTLTTNGILTVTSEDGTITNIPLLVTESSGSINFDIDGEGDTFITLEADGSGTGHVLFGHDLELNKVYDSSDNELADFSNTSSYGVIFPTGLSISPDNQYASIDSAGKVNALEDVNVWFNGDLKINLHGCDGTYNNGWNIFGYSQTYLGGYNNKVFLDFNGNWDIDLSIYDEDFIIFGELNIQDGLKIASLTEGILKSDSDGAITSSSIGLSDLDDVDLTDIDDGKILKYNSTSEKWECEDESSGTVTQTIVFGIGNGSDVITTGYKEFISVPYSGTIKSVTALAKNSGSVVVDIWKTTYADYDAGSTHPVDGDSITSSAPITISSAVKSTDSTLSGWTTSILAGDVLAFNVDSCSGITKLTLTIEVEV